MHNNNMPGHAIAPFLCAHKMFSVEYSNLCALTLVLFLAAHTQAENSNMQMIVLVKSLEQSCCSLCAQNIALSKSEINDVLCPVNGYHSLIQPDDNGY